MTYGIANTAGRAEQAVTNPADMTKSVYDTNSSGVVDNAERLGGELPEHYATAEDLETLAVAVSSNAHRNLLHNWDFRNPVNRRGLTTYAASGITIDGWALTHYQGQSITIVPGGITMSAGEKWIRHPFDVPPSFFSEKVLTGSVLLSDGTILSGTAIMKYVDDATTETTYMPEFVSGVNAVAVRMIFYGASKQWAFEIFNISAESSAVTIAAAKLEFGSVSTLANDKPADYAEQYALCAQYDALSGKRVGLAAVLDYSVTIPAANWSATAPYTQKITVTGLTAERAPELWFVPPDTAEAREAQRDAAACISLIETGMNSLTVTCDEDKPETDIVILLREVF